MISVAQHQGVPPELRGLLAFKNTDQAQITRHQRDMNWVRTYADRFDWFAGSLLLLDESGGMAVVSNSTLELGERYVNTGMQL